LDPLPTSLFAKLRRRTTKHDLSSDQSDVLEAAANPAKRRKLKDNALREDKSNFKEGGISLQVSMGNDPFVGW
jgi:hypothetical protein